MDANWDGTRAPVAFAAPLSSANANVGATFASKWQYQGLLMELDGLAAMGVTAILVEAPFPVFQRAYYATDAAYQQYLDFYRQVARDVKARGLTLIVDSAFLLARADSTAYANPGPFYRSLSWEEYVAGRAENAEAVLRIMQPDFLVVLQEPDTEVLATGFTQAGTPDGATELLTAILDRIQSVRGATRIGAGVGSWQFGYRQFVERFTATSIDFVDMHVFEANYDFLPQAIEIADIAAAAGKGTAISGAWLTKSTDAEVIAITAGQLSDTAVLARDAFSFSSPLDTAFMDAFVKFAHWKRLEFFAPFFVQNLRAYLPYDLTTQGLTPAQISARMQQLHVQNLVVGKYSPTGVSYSRAILPAPDVTPPGPAATCVAVTGSNGTTLFWSAAPDNVGVAGYVLYRNGVAMARTVRPY